MIRNVRLARQAVVTERRADGCLVLRSPDRLPDYPRRLTERLDHWAERAPDRVFLAQRGPAGWAEQSIGRAAGRRALG